VARGVVTSRGSEHRAPVVLVNADPFRLRQLAGEANFTPELNSRLDGMRRDGTTMKARGMGVSRAACVRSKYPQRTACGVGNSTVGWVWLSLAGI
jgi:hypothetical protein